MSEQKKMSKSDFVGKYRRDLINKNKSKDTEFMAYMKEITTKKKRNYPAKEGGYKR